MNGNQTRETPLAWSQNGEPIELPDAAALWRVRRLIGNGKGGAPELVYGDDGLPLLLEITTTAADFQEAVERKPGKYRLDAIDELRRPIQGVPPAYVNVSGGPVRSEPAGPAGGGDVALRTLADVFVKQSAQVSTLIEACTKLVAAVDAAGVSRREPTPVVVAAAPVAAVRNGTDPDEGEDDESDESEDEVPAGEPSTWDHITKFCATLPPENLRVCIEGAPELAANTLTKVIQRGVGGLLPGVGDGKGGAS